MKQVHFEKLAEPFKAMAELNLKTLQELSWIKPEEFAAMKTPQEVFEKQMKVMLENGYKTLEHMQKSFQIMEKALLDVVPEEVKKTYSKKQ